MTKLFSRLLLLTAFFTVNQEVISQILFPSNNLNRIHNTALEFNKNTIPEKTDLCNEEIGKTMSFIDRHESLMTSINPNIRYNSKSLDTLYVGETLEDSVYITGTYSFDGTIVVFGDGKLVFEDADALINGDILVYGDAARLWITNSTMHFPQSYIYERAMVAAGNAIISISNSTLDYYGLSHDLVITEDALVIWEDITKIGFTTCGLYANGSIDINGANQAGEFVMTLNSSVDITDATTILLWHHVPETGSLDFIFPNGDNVANMSFDETTPGVSGIDFSYSLTNCDEVMWGLMPEPNSDITITDSELRTIGVWFKDQPAYHVTGLVNSSHYTDFTAPLTDFNIHLINTDVRTWSLYMFDGAQGDVDNCIIGEIGTMGNSNAYIENAFIDGSGGYLFATDQSLASLGFSYLNANFQTSGECFGIMAYSSQNSGRCIAFEKSIMIIVQANLIEAPEYKDDAMMWFLEVVGSSNNFTESEVSIEGSAWIEKASDYYQIDFGWYVVEYQKTGEEEWIAACDTVFNEVFDGELCQWDTEGLTPGTYAVRLTMSDDSDDPNIIMAIKQVTLTVNPNKIDIINVENKLSVYPNPANYGGSINLNLESYPCDIAIIDLNGKTVKQNIAYDGSKINLLGIKPGMYFVKIAHTEKTITKKLVIK